MGCLQMGQVTQCGLCHLGPGLRGVPTLLRGVLERPRSQLRTQPLLVLPWFKEGGGIIDVARNFIFSFTRYQDSRFAVP